MHHLLNYAEQAAELQCQTCKSNKISHYTQTHMSCKCIDGQLQYSLPSCLTH